MNDYASVVEGSGAMSAFVADDIRRMIPAYWLEAIDADDAGVATLDLHDLAAALSAETRSILPTEQRWFRALELTRLEDVRAVILGQDPYPDARRAEGLAFSVPDGAPVSASLRRILCEASAVAPIGDGRSSLVPWAERGVLLLNTALTTPAGSPGGHLRIGWQAVTLAVLRAVARRPGPILFLAWGAKAQGAIRRAGIVDGAPHVVCASVHPAERTGAFAGSDPFGCANRRLQAAGAAEIDWSLA